MSTENKKIISKIVYHCVCGSVMERESGTGCLVCTNLECLRVESLYDAQKRKRQK